MKKPNEFLVNRWKLVLFIMRQKNEFPKNHHSSHITDKMASMFPRLSLSWY